jgi:hypothetical protein
MLPWDLLISRFYSAPNILGNGDHTKGMTGKDLKNGSGVV